MAELGREADARRSYALAIHQGELAPEEELEGAAYILQTGGDYKISHRSFLSLYRRGQCREAAFSILTGAFYEPNIKELRGRYERNCRLLKKYPYLFRKDFPAFEDLPIQFYPYDKGSYVPFYPGKGEFGELVELRREVISRYFFRDLEKPVLAEDVWSQYELEYLRDNVRRSDWVGRENHIYLHYRDWEEFCAWLQVWNMRALLEEEKIVFLIGDEISRYPIDFKEEFGIDYSQYPVKPLGVREITRMIWLAQLQSHNGIFFFAEILDGHPNLLCQPAWMMDQAESEVNKLKREIEGHRGQTDLSGLDMERRRIMGEVHRLKDATDKDYLVAGYLADKKCRLSLDPASRIAPALLFSPHFENICYNLEVMGRQKLTLSDSEQFKRVRNSPIFKNFKYIKTVGPFRRPTTGCAAAIRFMWTKVQESWKEAEKDPNHAFGRLEDDVTVRAMSRSYMADPLDRIFRDAVVIRFEDGKLNPKATFTALAEFMDLPYAESLTYCSKHGEIDPDGLLEGDAKGMDTRAVYATHSEWLGEPERYYLEFFLQDAYRAYGYDFHYYDGEPVDEAKLEELCSHFDVLDGYIETSVEKGVKITAAGQEMEPGSLKKEIHESVVRKKMEEIRANRLGIGKGLLQDLRYVNREGQALRVLPMLEPKPELLEQPLYH